MLGDWFMADMQCQSPQHLTDLHKTLHKIPQTNSAFICCFLVKEHTHREAGVYCFSLVTAADHLRIQFYASQKGQAAHRPTRRLSLLQRSCLNVQCPAWHRTRHFHSYLLTEDICELAEGLSCVSSCSHKLPAMALFITRTKLWALP